MRVLLCGVLSVVLMGGVVRAEEGGGDVGGVTVLTQVTFRTVVVPWRGGGGGAVARLARSWKPWLLPGLGHADVGEVRRGVVLMGLFGGCALSAGVFEMLAWSAYGEHRRLVPLALAEPDLDRRRQLMEAAVGWYDRYTVRHSWAQAAAVGALVVWGYGLFDYFEALRGWGAVAGVSGGGMVLGWRRSW